VLPLQNRCKIAVTSEKGRTSVMAWVTAKLHAFVRELVTDLQAAVCVLSFLTIVFATQLRAQTLTVLHNFAA
jgi:hypothetical protein